jgi:hypothetical protein
VYSHAAWWFPLSVTPLCWIGHVIRAGLDLDDDDDSDNENEDGDNECIFFISTVFKSSLNLGQSC